MEIGTKIGFIWNDRKARWMDMYMRLIKYKEEYGTTTVPVIYEPDQKLGNWVTAQRRYFKQCRINQERIDLLNKIGFVWHVLPSTELSTDFV